MYVPGYAELVPAYDKYRINQAVNRAWEGNPHFRKTMNKLLFYLVLNYLVIYPMMITVSYTHLDVYKRQILGIIIYVMISLINQYRNCLS